MGGGEGKGVVAGLGGPNTGDPVSPANLVYVGNGPNGGGGGTSGFNFFGGGSTATSGAGGVLLRIDGTFGGAAGWGI